MADARLYEVRMARGMMYALQDLADGTLWTERTEQAAIQLAREKRLTITQEAYISHEELLRRIGHKPTLESLAPHDDVVIENVPLELGKEAKPGAAGPLFIDVPTPRVSFPVHYYFEDDPNVVANDPDVVSSPVSQRVTGVFCSEDEITPTVWNAFLEKSGDSIIRQEEA